MLKLVTEYLGVVDRIYEYSGDPLLDAQPQVAIVTEVPSERPTIPPVLLEECLQVRHYYFLLRPFKYVNH